MTANADSTATASNSPRIAQISLVFGLVGVAFGLFVGGSDVIEALEIFKKVQIAPYVLGGISMLAAIVSLVIEKQYKFGAVAFASGAGAVLIGLILVYVMIAIFAVLLIGVFSNQ